MAVIGKRFGDEQSNLLDEFERVSYETHATQLNRTMLERSLSEPAALARRSQSRLVSMAPIPVVTQVMMMQGPRRSRGRGSGIHKFLKKLLKPIIGRNRGAARNQVPDAKDPPFCKDFSRSLRFWSLLIDAKLSPQMYLIKNSNPPVIKAQHNTAFILHKLHYIQFIIFFYIYRYWSMRRDIHDGFCFAEYQFYASRTCYMHFLWNVVYM